MNVEFSNNFNQSFNPFVTKQFTWNQKAWFTKGVADTLKPGDPVALTVDGNGNYLGAAPTNAADVDAFVIQSFEFSSRTDKNDSGQYGITVSNFGFFANDSLEIAGDTINLDTIATAGGRLNIHQVGERQGNAIYFVNGYNNPDSFADVGDAEAIPANASGLMLMTTGGTGETNTLADPSQVNQQLTLTLDVDGGGNRVVTSATAINQTGNNTLTFADAGDTITLVAVQSGGSKVWRVIGNDGVALTTV